jgi:hypothetical protein
MTMSITLQAVAREYVSSDIAATVIAEQALRLISADPSMIDGDIDAAIRVVRGIALQHSNVTGAE